MSNYQRKATNDHNQFQTIADAYTAFGLPAPTRALDLKRTVEAGAANVEQTAARLALEALTTDQDPQDWHADALEQIKDAQAREALAGAFARNYANAVARALPQYLTDATTDLQAPVDRLIKKLTTAAKKLPAGTDALDPEANINNDSGGALAEVRESLTLLSAAASVFKVSTPQGITPALQSLLAVVELPNAVTEKIKASLGETVVVLNKDHAAGTYTIRKIADEAKKDADLALVNIARGDHKDATLSLATPEQYRQRLTNAAQAYKRETIREGSGGNGKMTAV